MTRIKATSDLSRIIAALVAARFCGPAIVRYLQSRGYHQVRSLAQIGYHARRHNAGARAAQADARQLAHEYTQVTRGDVRRRSEIPRKRRVA